MEIKHTVEILTKDIQEIEKLVRNLNNSPAPPRIELDLTLSKLRNVYELLSMIREDVEEAVRSEKKPVEKTIKQAQGIETEQTPVELPKQAHEPVDEHPIEQLVEEKIPEPEKIPEAPVTIAEPPVQAKIPMDEPLVNEKEPVQHKKKEAEILAEKFSNDPSINENIASSSKTTDVSSKIIGQAIDNIGRNIGINDRFLIIRELFEGDNENYTQLIHQLDSSSSAQEAIGLLELKFPDEAEHEGYQLLAQLARRKFISE